MSLSNSFELLSFQRKVQDALQVVERALELERKPCLAGEVDHAYGAKFALVNAVTNTAIIAYMHCFENLGLRMAELSSIDRTQPVTLRFEASTSRKFLKEIEVEVPLVECKLNEREETNKGDSSSSMTTTKSGVKSIINRVTEFHWEVTVDWNISIYAGTAVKNKKIIMSRVSKTGLITQSEGSGNVETSNSAPIELSLSWLMKQIKSMNFQFNVDLEDVKTRTPRRNAAVQDAEDFATRLRQWCASIRAKFLGGTLKPILHSNNPAKPTPATASIEHLLGVKKQYSLFNPILPLMEERERDGDVDNSSHNTDEQNGLLSAKDVSRLLDEHMQTLARASEGIKNTWPSASKYLLLSSAEATLSFLCDHIMDLTDQYTNTMEYIESMMETQLISAIGKRLTSKDLDDFVKYHNARLLSPCPRPFSHAIRRPEHYPVGLLTIETEDEATCGTSGEIECIQTHAREVNSNSSLKIPLTASTILELTGNQYLHGYMNHRFQSSSKSHQLVARARQFSSFIMVIGNMADATTLEPKDAIIVLNKDEVLIPLLLEELPTAKEFKDAVKSLSPEQQRFARAYRSMQLASSVFGVCIIQIKPQLEVLLGLPAGALDKEMKLTQDLMELFVEYQIPSDMLSYNGVYDDSVALQDILSNVKDNVKGVVDVIESEKEKQLKAEQAKTKVAVEMAVQSAVRDSPHYRGRKLAGAPRSPMVLGAPAYTAAMRAKPYDSDLVQAAPVYRTKGAKDVDFRGGLDNDLVDDLLKELSEQMEEKVGNILEDKVSQQNHRAVMASVQQGVDFTLTPKILDTAIELNGEGSALRSTTIKTGPHWVRKRQENLLSSRKTQTLSSDEIKVEKNKAFDLLDALSRSGSLPIPYSDLHVVVAVTHCFDKDVMSTVVCDNVNPIEKLERSTLLLASAVHGVPARELIGDVDELHRLEKMMQFLIQPADTAEDKEDN